MSNHLREKRHTHQDTLGESSGHAHQHKLQRAASLPKQVTLSINTVKPISAVHWPEPLTNSVVSDKIPNVVSSAATSSTSKFEKDTPAQKNNHQQLVKSVIVSVNGMLSKVHLSNSTPSIYRVPDSIRGMNPQCYTPRLVSIGPFHRDNPQLKPTQDLKNRYFNNFFRREPNYEHKLSEMVNVVADMESDIRNHYPPDEMIKLNSEDFCRMILVDATFVAELIIVMNAEGDPTTEKPWFFRDLLNDILLLENQIPLFIIYVIYNKFYEYHMAEKFSFPIGVHKFINNMKTEAKPLPTFFRTSSSIPEGYPLHFIDYLRLAYGFEGSDSKGFCDPNVNLKQEQAQLRLKSIKGKEKVLKDDLPPSSPEDSLRVSDSKGFMLSDPNVNLKQEQAQSRLKSIKGKEKVLEDSMRTSSLEDDQPSSQNRRPNQTRLPPKKNKNWKSDIITSSRLLKYGVQFEVGTTTSLMDITFNKKKGILKINKVIVNDSTENIFRNIVAYEQCDLVSQTYVSDYLIFMDSLIDTPDDVNILTNAGIIQNDLRDDEKVCQIFNTLHKEVITEQRDYLFAVESRKLNDYRRNMWHQWNATWYNWKSILKRDYFSSPWSTLAFIIATTIVALTIIQTICSIYQAKGKTM